ncbi:hypothetical protein [Thiorhodococcus minor]|uniref:Uncharacterized protein n=1 Tax=Thiorhodococcus minor TaxID=57489 RepID=A0A6M0JVM7_9GAMM|nr:hypothetical protein [Thiorhodococcus minor]NEV60377.1 hypothetical protein [Thiorhodococcus minor]
MIHEYAIEPHLVANAGSLARFRFWSLEFGLGTPRIMAQLPKKKNWRRLVFQAMNSNTGDVERTRVEALIGHLTSSSSCRETAVYDGALPWIDNALSEHARQPFRAILAAEDRAGFPAIIVAEPLERVYESESWQVKRSICVPRNADSMAAAVEVMLACCRVAIFVDSHFGPENPRHRRPMEKFFAAMRSRDDRLMHRLEICTGSSATLDFLEQEFRDRLARHLSPGTKLILKKLTQQDTGEKIHNRYIITELGGVQFGTGMDDGKKGENDDVNLMDIDQYLQRWDQYCDREKFAFDCEEVEIEI